MSASSTTPWVRPTAVAGTFYPKHPDELQAMLGTFARQAAKPKPDENPPKALIVPHAGYIYSGPIAASAYARLTPLRGKIQRVVLIGPAHRLAFAGLAGSSAAAFASPLGAVEVDRQAYASLADLPFVRLLDQAHHLEHALEVHLPFLITALDHTAHPFKLVPLLAGDTTAQEVAAALRTLWGTEETLIVVSSDLSHYHVYEDAKLLDKQTSAAIENLALGEIQPEQACGCLPIQGLLQLAMEKGLRAHTVDLRNSGDTAGPRDRVVGYGAYVLAN
ncbi:MAG: AmmeMemoRadiSam system protein B [Phycisphaeraceae bacterium]|nr:AmmeMemoRadiSam system protein B [Phycisphaeraceae bacterium]